jgi:hypothetical protein
LDLDDTEYSFKSFSIFSMENIFSMVFNSFSGFCLADTGYFSGVFQCFSMIFDRFRICFNALKYRSFLNSNHLSSSMFLHGPFARRIARLALALSPHFATALHPVPLIIRRGRRYSLLIPFGTGIEGIQCGMRLTIRSCQFICSWFVKAAVPRAALYVFLVRLEGVRLPHAATSPTKILGRRALRARRDMGTCR